MTTVSPKVEPGSRPQCASTRDRWLLHQGELWFVSKLNSTSGSALICFFIILTFTLTLVHCRNHEEQHSEDPEEHDGKEDVKDMEEQKTKETNEIEEDFERPQVTLKISRWMNKPTPNTRQSRISVIELKRSAVVHVFSWIFSPPGRRRCCDCQDWIWPALQGRSWRWWWYFEKMKIINFLKTLIS